MLPPVIAGCFARKYQWHPLSFLSVLDSPPRPAVGDHISLWGFCSWCSELAYGLAHWRAEDGGGSRFPSSGSGELALRSAIL